MLAGVNEEHDVAGEGSPNAQVGAIDPSAIVGDCVKCVEPVEKREEGSLTRKSRQIVHITCASTYKAAMRRCGKDIKYKAWWDRMSTEDAIKYYRERRKAIARILARSVPYSIWRRSLQRLTARVIKMITNGSVLKDSRMSVK